MIKKFLRYMLRKLMKDIKDTVLSIRNWTVLLVIASLILVINKRYWTAQLLLLISLINEAIVLFKFGHEKPFDYDLRHPPIWWRTMVISTYAILLFFALGNKTVSFIASLIAIFSYLMYEWTKGHWRSMIW